MTTSRTLVSRANAGIVAYFKVKVEFANGRAVISFFLMGVAPIWSLKRFPPGHWVHPWVGKTAVGRAGAGLQ